MNIPEEFLNAIEILIDKRMQNTAQIYTGRVIGFSGGKCVVNINGRNQIVQFYGSAPTVNSMYRVFVPQNNMSMAFIITGGDGSSPTPTPEATDYNALKNLLSINNITLSGNKNSGQLNLYGNDNPPPYPVTSVNGQTGVVVLDANDIGAYTKEEVSSLLLKKPNPNLLDNWYFGNPVNQRGKTSYAGAAAYTIDRWKLTYDTNITINDGYITLSGYWDMAQPIDKASTPIPGGTVVTFSVLLRNKSATAAFRYGFTNNSNNEHYAYIDEASTIGDKWTLFTLTTTLEKSANNWQACLMFVGKTGSVDILAAKLELGSQQTLAHQDADGNWVLNEIPNYGEQLARCQRYYWQGPTGAYGYVTGTTAKLYFPTPVTMRTNPVITEILKGAIAFAGGATAGFTSLTSATASGNVLIVETTLPSSTNLSPCSLVDCSYGFSADL